MTHLRDYEFTQNIVDKAVQLGASLAGVVSADDLRISPSHQEEDVVDWVKIGRSVIVMALLHEKEKPDLDWWDGDKGTPGNRCLIRTGQGLAGWLQETHGLRAWDLPYYPAKGGVFLKDACAMAGLGMIGRNNLLLTREHGSSVRLRGLACEVELAPTPALGIDLCKGCPMPCRKACPQDAFQTGVYARDRCLNQMTSDEDRASPARTGSTSSVIRYCRACEFHCPLRG